MQCVTCARDDIPYKERCSQEAGCHVCKKVASSPTDASRISSSPIKSATFCTKAATSGHGSPSLAFTTLCICPIANGTDCNVCCSCAKLQFTAQLQ
ncbi:hypothetical protein PsorP6_009739 [Peronosclerospora sorghi]|uniref:Uncharacterized protein n=1 Tax=Peronosclerospora sorghi TaxID=230839 RepID=A0ACC0W0G9_9STRA|nr:hypothetical protein PsorP6_009739 [Peronosclerospora sorghi]